MNEQNTINVQGVSIPVKPLTNLEIDYYAKQLKIKHYRGNYMRDTLPNKIKQQECAIVNLDTIKGPGTHYVCYYKNKSTHIYFDSFGLPPPQELIKYIGKPPQYNSTEIQKRDSVICGAYCLYVLKALSDGYSFNEVWESLVK